jgi:hypothetical protein
VGGDESINLSRTDSPLAANQHPGQFSGVEQSINRQPTDSQRRRRFRNRQEQTGSAGGLSAIKLAFNVSQFVSIPTVIVSPYPAVDV